MERGDPRVRELVASVAGTVSERLASVTGDIQDVIELAIPGLQSDESAALLHASIGENVDAALQILADAGARTVVAPPAAVDYARRLAQQDVPASALVRAYRVGQAWLLRHCIEELLRQSPGDHLEGLATLEMAESVSDYIEQVVEDVLTAYAAARDAWLGDRSAVLAMRIREILRGERVDLAAIERGLDYRFDQYHLGLVLWVEASDEPDSLPVIRRLVSRLGQGLELAATPLVVPADENSSAWAWLPTQASLARMGKLGLAAKIEPAVTLAVGEPATGIEGFRRSHRQALSARAVALAAGDDRAPITPFADVAPIAMLCADIGSARAWIQETLGDLAVASTRNEGLRETARVFLQTGGSYTATAEQLFLHRNTTQYRVRKAEEVRGRPLRDGRLDVEVALLACHWLKAAVLQRPG